MFRLKMAASLVVLLVLVVVLSLVLYWGGNEAKHYFQRSALAHDVLDSHVVLAERLDRFFQEQINAALISTPQSAKSLMQTRIQIEEGFAKVRESIEREQVFLGEHDFGSENDEVAARLNRLEQLLNQSMVLFEKAAEQKQLGHQDQAVMTIGDAYAELFEGQMWPIIHAVVREKRHDVAEANTRESSVVAKLNLMAVAVPGGAVLLTLLLGLHLYRSLTYPLERLLEGTHKIGEGNLAHRIPELGRNEFGRLGERFNAMTNLVEDQRQALLNSNAQLESQVAERTRELREANESLQRVAQLRSRFFADISHELRTPLTIIRGEAEVSLRAKQAPLEEYRESMHHIEDLAIHLSRLVDDLFYLSRSETGGLRYERELLEFNGLLRDSLAECDVLIAESGLRLESRFPDQESYLMADRDRLRQMLLIVIDNACRYSPRGGTLTVGLSHEDRQLRLEVRDQGVGIAEADLDAVFERHFRSTKGAELVSGGAGLGLPLAKAIVHNHDGRIEVLSEQGVGTAVVIRLPLHCGAVEI